MSGNSEAHVDRRAERGDATRAALVAAARELFAERGYGAVGTSEIVRRAGVTRGAMYHHFADKRDLFRAVYEQVEHDLVATSAERILAVEDPWEQLVQGTRAFFDACEDPALMRIGLADAPSVLGWQEWREIGMRYALGALTFTLQRAVDGGVLRPADVRQLAHLLFGALGEAALLIANADDPRAMRADAERTVLALLEGLRA